jgi:outer membrane biosynthesis protein TonB
MQHTRTVTPAVAATDDAALVERMQALEKRVATTEVELQMRSGGSAAPEWRAWEERIARLENRLGAVEDRAAVAARRDERSRTAPATAARQVVPQASPRQIAPSTPRAVTPPKPAPAPPPPQSVAPRPSPDEGESVSAPEVAASPRVEASAPVAAATPITPPAPPRESPRARVEPPAQDPSLGDKLRRDWDAIKRQARRGGEEWRDGWDQLKRLFGY